MKLFTSINRFSTLADTTNYRVPLHDPQSAQKLDNYFDRYQSILGAYVYKRKLDKSQIWPKIHIIDGTYSMSKVVSFKKVNYQIQVFFSGIDEKMMQKMVKEDPSTINSSYIISIFCQDNFKQLIDEYVNKTLICGKAPKDQVKVNQIQQKVKKLYRIFYFGQQITPLQRQLQVKYLTKKQHKYFSFHNQLKQGKKNQYSRCIWRQQDQRIVEDLANWQKKNYNNTDIGYRPFFEPLGLLTRLDKIQKMHRLMGETGILDRWKFNRQIKVYYTISNAHFTYMAKKLYTRIGRWLGCIEFTNLLKIPPDFIVEMSVYVVHIWLITNRLNQINTKQSRYLSKTISDLFDQIINIKTAELNVKKQGVLLKQLYRMFTLNQKMLKYHFYLSETTKNNNYRGIDALVWSIVFGQKVERYGDEVYLFSEYLIKNFQMLKLYSEDDLLNGLFEFDAYLVDPKYKQNIQKVNPPLSKQQFQEQMDSDKKYKKYTYSEIQTDQTDLEYYSRRLPNLEYSWKDMIFDPVRRFFTKYQTLKTMDHYDEMEKQQKQEKKKSQQSMWKSKKDEVQQVQKEFKRVKDIRRQVSRKNWSSNIK